MELQRWEAHPNSPPAVRSPCRGQPGGPGPLPSRAAHARVRRPSKGEEAGNPTGGAQCIQLHRGRAAEGELRLTATAAGRLAAARRTGAAGRRRGQQAPPRLLAPATLPVFRALDF